MSIYVEVPNIVKIVISDDSGEASRCIVNKSLEEVIAMIETAFGAKSTVAAAPKKARKPRRTKAEMSAAAEPAPEGVPPSHRRTQTDKTEPAGSVWPE